MIINDYNTRNYELTDVKFEENTKIKNIKNNLPYSTYGTKIVNQLSLTVDLLQLVQTIANDIPTPKSCHSLLKSSQNYSL